MKNKCKKIIKLYTFCNKKRALQKALLYKNIFYFLIYGLLFISDCGISSVNLLSVEVNVSPL